MRLLRRRDDAKRRARQKTRRRARPGWLRLAARLGALALLLGALGGGGAWLWQSGRLAAAAQAGRAAALEASARAGLAVSEVFVEGRRETSQREVLRALAVETGQPILAFDPEAARRRLTALPWVRAASVGRLLPGRIVVRIVERRALALWQRGGKLALIDDTGTVITERGLGRFRDLLIVVGEDAPAHAPALVALIAEEPALAHRVAAAVRVGARRWNVRLKNGIDIRLPEDSPLAAWHRLAELERAHGLLSREVESVDLRLPDRLILRTKDGPPRIDRKSGRNT